MQQPQPNPNVPVESRIIRGLLDIPKYDPNNLDPFWKELKSPALKAALNVVLVQFAKAYDPTILSDEACRSQLSKIFAIAKMIDIDEAFLSSQKGDPTPNPSSDPSKF